MGMKLDKLALLYANMKAQGITKTKFDFAFRNLLFSVIYIAEQFPHEILFGCRAHDLFFVVQVQRDFTISTYLGDSYRALMEALGLHPNPSNRFSPNVFFEEFKSAIPQSATPANVPTVTDIASISRDVEEANKIYFLGWLPHDGIRSKPSADNLAKTKRICGHVTYNTCLRHHISSRWTDIEKLAQQYHEPGA
ncbi:MAG: DUF6037 family protein [Methylobacter sp.]|nr:DUF6037 family protein [Methylobacter sp.]